MRLTWPRPVDAPLCVHPKVLETPFVTCIALGPHVKFTDRETSPNIIGIQIRKAINPFFSQLLLIEQLCVSEAFLQESITCATVKEVFCFVGAGTCPKCIR